MTITKEYDSITLVCDVCAEEVRDFDTFQDALDHAKAEEWTRHKSKSGEWENYCPKCARS